MARLICLRMLTDAPRTRAQLGEALRRKGVPEEAARAVLDRFTDVGLIDDRCFAEAWVASRHAGRGLASRALRQELHQRGVDRQTAAEAVGRLDADTERETARRLVHRRAQRFSGLAPEVASRRLVSMLARKGYPAGLAYAVVKDELAETSVTESESDEVPAGTSGRSPGRTF